MLLLLGGPLGGMAAWALRCAFECARVSVSAGPPGENPSQPSLAARQACGWHSRAPARQLVPPARGNQTHRFTSSAPQLILGEMERVQNIHPAVGLLDYGKNHNHDYLGQY